MSTALDTAPAATLGMIAPGHVLGRYELLMPIAAGGMAMVWAARLKGSRGFQKIVAVKTMLPKLSEDVQFEQMFLDEASLASQVRHPHVVEILDLGEQDGVLFLVMEWIDGVPLNQLMKAAKPLGGMPLPIAVRVVMQALAGLHAAHELRDPKGQLVGLVHRDVSPQNILVTYDGVTKVVDFGVAKATAVGEGATGAGQIKGKVGYMAPEQIEGDNMDRRADLFAMGIVLYALTTGKHPFRRESDAATMYNICSPQPALAPSKFIPDYPEPLERVLLKALAKSAPDRYDTANDMLRDLDQVLPPDQRANTDEDVALFVRKLVGDRLEERRGTMRTALARADEYALTTGMRERSAPAMPSSATASMLIAAPVPPVANTRGTDTTWAPTPKRNRLGVAVGAALLLAGAGAAAALLSGREPAEVTPPPPVSTTPVTAQPLEPSQPTPPAPPAPPPTQPVTTAPERPPAAIEEPRPKEQGQRWRPPATPSPPAATTGSPPVKPARKWMSDPGF